MMLPKGAFTEGNPDASSCPDRFDTGWHDWLWWWLSNSAAVPNFQGQWSGTWVRQQCTETGSAVGQFCAGLTGGGLTLTLTQSGTSAQGSLVTGIFQFSVSGPIGATGALTLTGQGTAFGGTLTLNNWQSQIIGTTMTGSFSFSVQSSSGTPVGSASVIATLQGVVRVS